MKRCDEEAKKKCKALIDAEDTCNIKHVGIETPVLNGKIVDKNINVLVRELDAKKNKLEAIKEKVKEKHEWVDINVRNCFRGGVGVGTLKCIVGYNHHGKRNKLVNKGLTEDKCPRCEQIEDWEHVILCQSITGMKDEYLNELKSKMSKIAIHENERELVELIMKDIKAYVHNEDAEFTTTQQLIGMDLLFKGWVVKNWLNVNQEQSYLMKKLNKILVKHSVMFYSKAWVHRNEILHDTEKCREHTLTWYNNLVVAVENGDKPSVKRYVRMQRLDTEKCETSYIRLWIETTAKMLKEAKKEMVNDIRNYFSFR